MVHLYISDSTSRIRVNDGRIIVSDGNVDLISQPIETVDDVNIFGQPSMSTKFLTTLLTRGISLQFFTSDGHFLGRLLNPTGSNAQRIKFQVAASEDERFCLEFSKIITRTKIQNQLALLNAYNHEDIDISVQLERLAGSENRVGSIKSLEELVGVEGIAAKNYFSALGLVVSPDFSFKGRSRRPPKDPFNAMISFGYSILYKNMIGVLEKHGLNPYIGFLHQDSVNHATLASDLMEEWRSLIVDDTILQLTWEKRVDPSMFTTNPHGGVQMSKDCFRAVAKAIGDKLTRQVPYRESAGDSYKYTFQYAVDLRINDLVKAIESKDPSLVGIGI